MHIPGRSVLVVLALNYDEFRAWCRDSGLRPNDREVVFADREERLRGLTNIKVIRYRRWDLHPDALRINRTAEIIEQRSQPWDSAAQGSRSSTPSPAPSSRPTPPTRSRRRPSPS